MGGAIHHSFYKRTLFVKRVFSYRVDLQAHVLNNPSLRYHTNLYYPLLDCITGEMESRFSDLGKSLMKSLQSCSH